MNIDKKFAYLDHNVLNDMHDGHEQPILDFLDENQLRVVYSDQNVDEISASIKRKDYFVSILSSLDALHINSPLDDNWKPTNELKFQELHPNDRIQELEEARRSSKALSDGSEFLTAIFGGNSDVGIVEAANRQLDEAQKMLDEALADSPELAGQLDLDKIKADMAQAKSSVATEFAKIEQELEKNGSPFVGANIKEHLGYDFDEISGVLAPNVVKKLWEMVAPKLGGYETVEEYQAAVITASGAESGLHGTKEQTVIQRANNLYFWLNLIGFHRDEKMGKPRRMKASMADMNHASYALTCCSHFICRDKRLRYKAEAIYEHLNVSTKIINPQSLYNAATC